MQPLLDVENLRVRFGDIEVVRGISFKLGREKLGIVGESGAGKSMVARALMRLVPPGARVTADRLAFDGTDLLAADERQMTRLRGRRLSLVMQDPRYSLNPLMRVGEQIAEAWWLHQPHLHGWGLHRWGWPRMGWQGARQARERALEMLQAVQIRDPLRVARLYPHELSGGMGQRVMIGMMLIAGPDLLIADEPTSALDVTVRGEVLALLDRLIAARGLGLVFISHDLNLVRRFCDRVVVMYAGRVVETLPAADLDRAEHPYTRGLLRSRPSIHRAQRRLPVLDRDAAWTAAP